MGDRYQLALIVLGLIATAFLGMFLYRELFPEYLIYQKDFVALEEFRSSYTHEPPAPFKEGVKQIVLEPEDKGPPVIDRCISCHVAVQIEAFSPTRIARDINGNILFDAFGMPVKEPNPDYIWKKLDEAIAAETNPQTKAYYQSLKTAHVGEHTYDVTRVLRMHPLIGRETRPFEFHPLEEYGCTSCHGGNDRGIVTDRAHGPVFDGTYETEFRGFVPTFLESDPDHDPKFSRVFNAKPSHRLLFQTTPIFPGALIQAKCMQCHQTTQDVLGTAVDTASGALKKSAAQSLAVEAALAQEKEAVASLLHLQKLLKEQGYENTVQIIREKSNDYTLPAALQEEYGSQLKFLLNTPAEGALPQVESRLVRSLGDEKTVEQFIRNFNSEDPVGSVSRELAVLQKEEGHQGTLFEKAQALSFSQALLQHVKDVSASFQQAVGDQQTISAIRTDVDELTKVYQRGQALFLSQACYACHRIAGFARGGVGPELTLSGDGYPWFIKESIVWPQADLKTSTMPNTRLDHEEVEALVTYLLAQSSKRKVLSETGYKVAIQQWEAGKKLPWEKPLAPAQIFDVRNSMIIFAVEGCASCHRLRGYESDTGFAIEKESPSFEKLQHERRWFQNLFPETILGSELIRRIDDQKDEIDRRIVDGVRQGSILEEIEAKYPGEVEALYSNFKFALRAKNDQGDLINQDWQERVRRVLKMYVQIYGLGRIIGPRPNWSGVYRSDEWLMEHFRSPTAHIPRSIMPVFPFDDSKFYALTYMLNHLAQKNVSEDHTVWSHQGFNPEMAFETYCSQCHGENRLGNGPVSEWIYPIPKNLRRPDFLRSLTKERVIESITHGVKGTPMPPWGELGGGKPIENKHPVLNQEQIQSLANWLFSLLPGVTVIPKAEEVPKWHYTPQDVIEELKEEGHTLEKEESPPELASSFRFNQLYAALTPVPSENLSVQELFQVVPNKGIGPEKQAYFIKKEYYTPHNIAAGQRFFVENCSPCHGKEADGTGVRAETMVDAKPRNLTNLDFIESRDDLRLLRSIKYGVSGTAMTPWGDLTSSLQRLQLVMFIRSLSEGQKERRKLTDALYQAFDRFEFDPAYDRELLKKQKEILFNIGVGLISLGASEQMLDDYTALISRKGVDDTLEKRLLEQFDREVQKLQLKKQEIESAPLSTDRTLDLNTVNHSIASWNKQKAQFITGLSDIKRTSIQEKTR
jgi:mono/diheme cytochrome c family protein